MEEDITRRAKAGGNCHVSRQWVFDLLEAPISKGLSVRLVAPMGFGKSSIMAKLIKTEGILGTHCRVGECSNLHVFLASACLDAAARYFLSWELNASSHP